MSDRRRSLAVGLAWLLVVGLAGLPLRVGASAGSLPDRLSNEAFWALSERLSEPDGYFRSDNLLSNELYFPEVLDRLVERVAPGGVYLGVGPEQNFSYIAETRPAVAFITDVRRGNLHLHLLYKALFELSADRAEFVSRLFSKPRPAHLGADSTITDIMDAYWVVETSPREVFDANLAAIVGHLTRIRALPLSPRDIEGIEYVYGAFYWFGPSITYSSSSSSGFGRNSMATYYQLMLATDSRGLVRSYLASEQSFAAVRDLQMRNLVVPVVGDFSGPQALRSIGAWVRDHGGVVSLFYLSNVEQYLRQQGLQAAFCANVASMPLGPTSTFVRSQSLGGGFRNMLGDMLAETRPCVQGGATPAPPLALAP